MPRGHDRDLGHLAATGTQCPTMRVTHFVNATTRFSCLEHPMVRFRKTGHHPLDRSIEIFLLHAKRMPRAPSRPLR